MVKRFDGYCWTLGFIGAGATGLAGLIIGVGADALLPFSGQCYWWFSVDSLSVYLSVLSLFLFLGVFSVHAEVSGVSRLFVGVSFFFSLVSYICVHSLGFWLCYEMSILPLLVLIVLESPYSERYSAVWYLSGYVVLTGLPMLLCILYFSFLWGSFDLIYWSLRAQIAVESAGVFLVLGVLFITKIPMPPFHVWLPIVHAEASSVVSVCLSGYIMKLGLLGVCRFCSFLTPGLIFSVGYLILCLGGAILFFCGAVFELDGKRWLALLSLAHIMIAPVCLSVCGYEHAGLSFVYCLGHGLSAGLVFFLLWLCYEVSGSRNWGILKFSLTGSLFFRVISAACFCTVASLPPTLQFFCELVVLLDCSRSGLMLTLLMSFYLFCGGLVPLFLLGCLVSRHYSASFGSGSLWVYMGCCVFLVFWGYAYFLVG